jgi:hypothetical protein
MDGAGTLAKGGSISLSDSASGLVSLSPSRVESQEQISDLTEESDEDGIDSNIYVQQAQILLQPESSTSNEAGEESAQSTSNQI